MKTNRSYSYGDGFFETIRMRGGNWLYVSQHLERIISGLQALQFSPEFEIDIDWLNQTINGALDSSEFADDQDVVVRLDFYRMGERGYLPSNDSLHTETVVSPIDNSTDGIFPDRVEDLGDLIEQMKESDALQFSVASSVMKQSSSVGHLKSTSAITYVQAALENQQRGLDDLLLLNTQKRVCEFISSNILLVFNDELYAVPRSDGPVDGTMISALREKFGMKIRSFRIDQLDRADLILSCNSVRGIHRMMRA